jgi:hypothetical protein
VTTGAEVEDGEEEGTDGRKTTGPSSGVLDLSFFNAAELALRTCEFHRFLTSFSLLPLTLLAISHQRLPNLPYAVGIIRIAMLRIGCLDVNIILYL